MKFEIYREIKFKNRTAYISLLGFLLFLNINGQVKIQDNNPVFPGWYADPEGVVFGDTYWIFPTYSAPYEEQVFLDAFSSKDLVTWKKHEKIIDTAEVKWAKRAMWAPAVIKKNNEYFLFFSANDIQNDEEIGGIGIAKASNPEGPYKDYMEKPLISEFYNGAQP